MISPKSLRPCLQTLLFSVARLTLHHGLTGFLGPRVEKFFGHQKKDSFETKRTLQKLKRLDLQPKPAEDISSLIRWITNQCVPGETNDAWSMARRVFLDCSQRATDSRSSDALHAMSCSGAADLMVFTGGSATNSESCWFGFWIVLFWFLNRTFSFRTRDF